MTLKPITWIRSEADLETHCARWQNAPLLAVDTEFMRTDTFFPIPALIQVHDGLGSYLLDPLQMKDLSPLTAILRSGSVTKAMHSCSEDLEVFHHLTGELPQKVIDTQIAAALCGYGFSVGYANLVEKLLDQKVPKDETRSDWLQRPLTPAQENYAALDVEYLFILAGHLIEKLVELERLAWAENEYQAMAQRFVDMQQPEKAYERLKGAWRLRGRSLAALEALACWRESVARSRNIPRSRVLGDRTLYDLAERMPDNLSQFHALEGMHASAVRRYGEQLLSILDEARLLDESTLPATQPQPPLDSQQRATVKKLRAHIAQVAEQNGIAPEMIAKRSDYEYMARAINKGAPGDSLLPPSMSGWRAEAVTRAMQEVL